MCILKHPRSKLFRRVLLFAAAMAVLSLVAGACGGDADEEEKPEETAATAPGGGEKSVDVSMGDNFFEPNEFNIGAGSEVTFNLTNDGAAVHNMRTAGEDNDYDTDDDSVSDPDVVSGGDGAVLTWEVPDEPG